MRFDLTCTARKNGQIQTIELLNFEAESRIAAEVRGKYEFHFQYPDLMLVKIRAALSKKRIDDERRHAAEDAREEKSLWHFDKETGEAFELR